MTAGRVTVGINLKMYFGHDETRRWLIAMRDVVEELHATDVLDVFVLPSLPSIPMTRDLFVDTGIRYGAQNVSWSGAGAFTGETSAGELRELGCTVAAVGHAERRAMFNEDDLSTAGKAAALVAAGITPIVCIGETDRGSVEHAVAACVPQIETVLGALTPGTAPVFAYEPVWAIGAASPAPPPHIIDVVEGLRERTQDLRVIYGGSAGPGLYQAIAPAVDGIFLGRRVHDPANLRAALAELIGPTARPVG